MKFLGPLNKFFRSLSSYIRSGKFFNQYKYTKDLINLAHLHDFKIVDLPVEVIVKYQKDEWDIALDLTSIGNWLEVLSI